MSKSSLTTIFMMVVFCCSMTTFIDQCSASKSDLSLVNIDNLVNKDKYQYSIVRQKRDVETPKNPLSTLIDEFTRPFNTSDVPEFPQELVDSKLKNSTLTDSHTYYNVTYLYDQPVAQKYWIGMNDVNSVRHEMLSNAHRRAATVKLSFKFPFYGYEIENVTIATGGFLFLGEAVHTWLAATQYIAPLMANFNTSINANSSIYYYDNKTAFTVQWDNVYLQEVTINSTQVDANGTQVRNTIEKPFSFQATLKKDGDIIFVYKNIPFEISKINEDKHPVKVGISDAYIIDRTIFFIRRKTIYEYHKVEMKNKSITNNTVIYFKAIPTCNSNKDCQSCISKNSNFECSWCEMTKKCSDGYDRHRQEWLRGKCDDHATTTCKMNSTTVIDQTNNKEEQVSGSDSGDSTANAANAAAAAAAAAASANSGASASSGAVKPISNNDLNNLNANQQDKLKGKNLNGKDQSKQTRKGGIAFSFMIFCLVSMILYWAMYAYKNPQSKPGQWMIKYRRPSQWRFSNNNSESRYATEFNNIN